jgi:hypothetical protein
MIKISVFWDVMAFSLENQLLPSSGETNNEN